MKKDLTGIQFNNLFVLKRFGYYPIGGRKRRAFWICKCVCGNEKIIAQKNLTNNHTKSCGCLRKRNNNSSKAGIAQKKNHDSYMVGNFHRKCKKCNQIRPIADFSIDKHTGRYNGTCKICQRKQWHRSYWKRREYYRQKNYKRKKAVLEENINAIEIFMRDGWVCQICGKKVNKKAVVPHLLAPTIDHIIPLSKGGKHISKNVQCTHFACNSGKKDRAVNDQLRIF